MCVCVFVCVFVCVCVCVHVCVCMFVCVCVACVIVKCSVLTLVWKVSPHLNLLYNYNFEHLAEHGTRVSVNDFIPILIPLIILQMRVVRA